MKKYCKTKEQIVLEDGSVLDFILDCGDRKNMYLCVRDGQVILKIPANEPKQKALDFLLSKSDWIIKNLNKPQSSYGFTRYENGEKINLLGTAYTLRLITSHKYFPPYFSDCEIVAAACENMQKERLKLIVDKLLKDYAAEQIQSAFDRLCKKINLYPAKVTVKTMKTRWGSCSSDGKISINFNIIYHDMECLEYVVIHELCHLKHMNHSKDFWTLVEKYCPDRKRIRKQLNEK